MTPASPNRSQPTAAENALRSLAARQHGVCCRAQAIAAGVPPSWLARFAESGVLEGLPGAVYRVRSIAATRDTAAMAAVLALGPLALVSHETAGSRWGYEGVSTAGLPHVLVPYGISVRRNVAAVIHRTRSVGARDGTVVNGLPMTTATRTLIDLAATMPEPAYLRLLDDALARRLVTADRLGLALRRVGPQGRAGLRVLSSTLAIWSAGGIESHAEALLARWLDRHRLVPPVRQLVVEDGSGRKARLDAAWPRFKVAVEVDGFAHHGDYGSFVSDRQRDSWLASMGFVVLRTTVADRKIGTVKRARSFDRTRRGLRGGAPLGA